MHYLNSSGRGLQLRSMKKSICNLIKYYIKYAIKNASYSILYALSKINMSIVERLKKYSKN